MVGKQNLNFRSSIQIQDCKVTDASSRSFAALRKIGYEI